MIRAMRTISSTGGDLSFKVLDGQDSVRQRLVQHLLFRLGEWYLDTSLGLPDEELIGQLVTRAPVEAVITRFSLEVEDVTGVSDVTVDFDPNTRITKYFQRVSTIFGDFDMEF